MYPREIFHVSVRPYQVGVLSSLLSGEESCQESAPASTGTDISNSIFLSWSSLVVLARLVRMSYNANSS